nr:hypothetical protein [Tanacetum cinerariifolium]
MEDRVMLNNSQGNKQEVEDHCRNVKFSKIKTSITTCNDSLNAKTSNVNFVCVTRGKCVLNDKHDMCVLHSLNDMNSRTKMPMAVPISTREPKRILIEIILFIIDSGCSKHMTGNFKLLTNFVDKFLGSVKFGNEQIAPILAYGDLKSTCYIHDLKGNDLLTGSRGTYLYSITLQDTSSPNPICLMAKATLSQAWLWHHRLSHLNFDTINLLSKNDILIGLPKLNSSKIIFVLLMSWENPNESLFKQIQPQAQKGGYNFYTWTYVVPCGDGENLDKMKEKGDACIFVGYFTQSRAYRVFNKRTRVIVETIHVNFDELPQMASDHVSSDPVPQC